MRPTQEPSVRSDENRTQIDSTRTKLFMTFAVKMGRLNTRSWT